MGRRWAVLAVTVLVVAVVGASAGRQRANGSEPDATKSGQLEVRRFDYDVGEFLVRYGSRTVYPERLRGSVHHPTTDGPYPLVVLLHGNHGTCRVVIELLVPCVETPVTRSVDSYKGYDYLGENLASHGYVVVSASANGTNGATYFSEAAGTEGRVQVLERTLGLVEAWSTKAQPAPIGESLLGRVDLTRIGMMGHSRGGEAVTRFITHNRELLGGRWPLRAVIALAPTDFARHTPHGVPFATLLPTCDGDVFDLHGARSFERGKTADPAPRLQWVVRGANHNWFNTIWTGDDGGVNRNSPCRVVGGSRFRLTAPQQRTVGLALMAAFLRRHVGGEVAFDAVASGVSCGPGCGELSERVRTSFLPGSRIDLGRPTLSGGAAEVATCDVVTTRCPSEAHRSWTPQLFLRWAESAELTLAELPTRDLRDRRIVLRLATDRDHPETASGPPRLEIRLTDTHGRSSVVPVEGAALHPITEWIYGSSAPTAPDYYTQIVMPATNGPAHVILGDVVVPVPASVKGGFDAGAVARIDILLEGERGAVYLGDISLQ